MSYVQSASRPNRRSVLKAGLCFAASALLPLAVQSANAASVLEIDQPELIAIPAGPFLSGSDRAERELGYQLDEAAYGHSLTRERKWYEYEYKRGERQTGAYQITRTLITNAQYNAFVQATGHQIPEVDEVTWKGYRLVHPYKRTRRHAWKDGQPPKGRGRHPVVLISHNDAEAYAAWLSAETGKTWRLPTWQEWEKAARGTDGRIFPWGNEWDPEKLNSHDKGPFDTLPVGSFPEGVSPFGMLDASGQVFEWTASETASGRYEVRGGSWDDSGCGVCRAAARHSRPAYLKHILVGFRLVLER